MKIIARYLTAEYWPYIGLSKSKEMNELISRIKNIESIQELEKVFLDSDYIEYISKEMRMEKGYLAKELAQKIIKRFSLKEALRNIEEQFIKDKKQQKSLDNYNAMKEQVDNVFSKNKLYKFKVTYEPLGTIKIESMESEAPFEKLIHLLSLYELNYSYIKTNDTTYKLKNLLLIKLVKDKQLDAKWKKIWK